MYNMLNQCRRSGQMISLICSSLANQCTSRETEVMKVNNVVRKAHTEGSPHTSTPALQCNNWIFIMSSVIKPSAVLRSETGQKWNENGTHFLFPQSLLFFLFLSDKYSLLPPISMESLVNSWAEVDKKRYLSFILCLFCTAQFLNTFFTNKKTLVQHM